MFKGNSKSFKNIFDQEYFFDGKREV